MHRSLHGGAILGRVLGVRPLRNFLLRVDTSAGSFPSGAFFPETITMKPREWSRGLRG